MEDFFDAVDRAFTREADRIPSPFRLGLKNFTGATPSDTGELASDCLVRACSSGRTVVAKSHCSSPRKESITKTHVTDTPSKLSKFQQTPLSYSGADADRGKKPSLAERTATDSGLNPGDRVEGLGNFGMPTGQLGTVEQANEEDVLVKWDDDGRMKLRHRWLKKVGANNGPAAQPKAS